jgi:hypothetical protein
METNGSLPCLEEQSATGTCPQLAEFNPHPNILPT